MAKGVAMALIDAIIKNKRTFDTEEKCIAYLEKLRWPGGVSCPSCGCEKISRILAKGKSGKNRRLYQCLEKSCRYQFSPTTGTIFHDSHLPLKTWFDAIALIAGSKTDISVNQLRLHLGIQYKTAQRMVQCIREAVQERRVAEERRKRSGKFTALDRSLELPVNLFWNGGTIIGNSMNIATSMARVAIRSPFYFAKYIVSKGSPVNT
ncbi:MAG: transposase [Acidobacteria bacterium]|nr:transposase [Acidobacteriota bacterium]